MIGGEMENVKFSGSMSATTDKPMGRIASISMDLTNRLEELGGLHNRMIELRSRLVGGVPVDPVPGPDPKVQNGQLDGVVDQIIAMGAMINLISEELSHLERI